MKKTDWTDRMLAALVELYPVETTAYTAAVLNLSESTVKLKARELGLVKMAKSRWMERADYIKNHFQECSFSEIGKALGITRMSVGRIAAALGLKRTGEEKHLISSRIRTQMVKRERRRIVFGLEPVTGIRVISNRAKAAQNAEQDSQKEEDIDISEEARSFRPIRINRDEPESKEENQEENNTENPRPENENTDSDGTEKSASKSESSRHVYREAIMTDGILVENIIQEINRLAETGTSDLGAVIFSCENA